MQSSKLNHLSCRQSHIMPLSPILKPLIVSTKGRSSKLWLAWTDWLLGVAAGVWGTGVHDTRICPCWGFFFFSILYLLVQGSGVFFFFSCFYNASCFYISYSVFHSIVLSTHKRYSQDMLKFCESTVCTIYSVYLTFQKARKCVAKKPQPVYWSTGTCVPTKEHWLLYTAPIYYL